MSDQGPITLGDCADLASGVYHNLDRVGVWRRVRGLVLTLDDESFKAAGYVSAPYISGKDMILAFRGTDSPQSGLDDGFMAPAVTREIAYKVAAEFFPLYTGVAASRSASNAFGAALWSVLQANSKHKSNWGTNMLPDRYLLATKEAVKTAAQWAFQSGFHLRCAVGHSLGGALAQCAAELGGSGHIPRIPGVSFNGPTMGKIRGMRLENSAGILTIDSIYDPLSNITRLAGNTTHASKVIDLKTAIPRVEPPPDAEAYGLEYDPKSSLLTNTLRGSQKDVFFAADFSHWFATKLGPALAEGHSIESIRRAFRAATYCGVGNQKLSAYFPQVGS